jgi:hypothetical protein
VRFFCAPGQRRDRRQRRVETARAPARCANLALPAHLTRVGGCNIVLGGRNGDLVRRRRIMPATRGD